MKNLFFASQLLLIVAEFFGIFVLAGGSKAVPTGINSSTIWLMAAFEAVMFILYAVFSGKPDTYKFVLLAIVGAVATGVAVGFIASLFGSQYLWPWLIGTTVVCLPISACILEGTNR